jgi:hypothetical protein
MTEQQFSGFRAPSRGLDEVVRAGRVAIASIAGATAFLLAAATAQAIVFQVNSNDDTSDSSWGDGQCSTGGVVVTPGGNRPECTFRAAIEEANAWSGRDAIRFSTDTSALYDVNGIAWLRPATDYPPIFEPVDIDGTTAPSYDPARTPRVVLVESGGFYGLNLLPTAGDTSIRGLTFGGFFYGVYLNGTDGVWIDRCAFGIHDAGTGSFVAMSGNDVGIHVNIQATETWIGAKVENDAFTGGGNTISGNGVGIENVGTDTRILGNRIGTDSSGTRREAQQTAGGPVFDLGNTGAGIRVENGGRSRDRPRAHERHAAEPDLRREGQPDLEQRRPRHRDRGDLEFADAPRHDDRREPDRHGHDGPRRLRQRAVRHLRLGRGRRSRDRGRRARGGQPGRGQRRRRHRDGSRRRRGDRDRGQSDRRRERRDERPAERLQGIRLDAAIRSSSAPTWSATRRTTAS